MKSLILIVIIGILCSIVWLSSYHTIISRIIYQTSFFDASTHHQIIDECNTLLSEKNTYLEQNELTTRYTCHTPSSSKLYDFFYNPHTTGMIETLLFAELGNIRIRPLYTTPIDVRKYEKGGSMNWHRDDILHVKHSYPQIEVVYTVENTSDSTTDWKEDHTKIIHSVHTTANSILITQGGSVFHRVTPVTTGNRITVKIAYEVYNA
jgi:hypothetical protein